MDNTSDRIKVELLNSNGAPIAYVTQANVMMLRMTNETGAAVEIDTGPLQNPPPAGGAFGVALYFSAFFTHPDDQANLSITADGWSAEYLGGSFPAWILGATRRGTWDDGEALEFTVSGFTPTVPVGSYFLSANVYNLRGMPPHPHTTLVGVANPPSGQNQDLAKTVQISVAPDTVTIMKADDPVVNRLVLSLTNTNPRVPVVPPEVPWGAHPPQFTLSFQYAEPPGFFALTTPDAANAFQVGIVEDPLQGWNPPVKAAAGPTWVITPKPGNHGVLGTGDGAMVQFSIDNVKTQLIPGPTLLYLQYNNVPGYDDGFLTLMLTKAYAEMNIVSFSAGQTSFLVPGLAPATAHLNWEVENAVLVQLSGVGLVPSKAQAYPVMVQQNESLVLTAYDPFLGAVATRTLDLSLVPPISHRWLPCGAIIAWHGDAAAIPPGFGLCDGTRGTPDLRDRFVPGAGGQEQAGSSGSSAHAHQVPPMESTQNTSNDGSHAHNMPGAWGARRLSNGSRTGIDTRGDYRYEPGYHSTQDAGDHSHALRASFSPAATGPVEGGLRPPWYALCYIMLLYPS